ncbi:hypothetical protein EVAR_18268_1 [Eumeta japonica]|uniref:Uncharacterized protein n=1 Tax=Eumeta variegata TaxID=151549 RepID=A0A4C1UJI3_EUMVA|nr:hypothetical protein EVAR_18268_1 [Eumeta japonica]
MLPGLRHDKNQQLLYLLVQWAAVRTCLSVMSAPPQYCSKPSGVIDAIHGHSRGLAGRAPCTRPWARVLTPQPVGGELHVNMDSSEHMHSRLVQRGEDLRQAFVTDDVRER